MDIKLEQIRAFGPSILKVRIPDKLVDQLNQYVDQVKVDKKKSKQLEHGKRLDADVKQEFVIETDFTKNSGWGNFLGSCVKAWIKRDMEKEITKFEIIQTWIVRQFQNEYNPLANPVPRLRAQSQAERCPSIHLDPYWQLVQLPMHRDGPQADRQQFAAWNPTG